MFVHRKCSRNADIVWPMNLWRNTCVISLSAFHLLMTWCRQMMIVNGFRLCSGRLQIGQDMGCSACFRQPHDWAGNHRPPLDSHRSFDITFVVTLNKLSNKQSSCRWFETPWRSCEVTVMSALVRIGLTQCGSKLTETEWSSGWLFWSSLQTLKTSFSWRTQWRPGQSSWRPFSLCTTNTTKPSTLCSCLGM